MLVVVVSFVTASGSGSGAAAAAAMGRGLAAIWVMVVALVVKRMVRYLNCIFGFFWMGEMDVVVVVVVA